MKRFKNFSLFIIILILFFMKNSMKFCNSSEINVEQYRLANTTEPKEYHIQIQTKLDHSQFKFNGEVKIILKVLVETDTIELHTKNATLQSVELKKFKNSSFYHEAITQNIKDYKINNVTEILQINCENKLELNYEYELKIIFESKLREDDLGFYRSSYQDKDNNTVWLAATQFAPTQARHAFPCYDEPRFKALFQLKLVHPKKLFALSNTETYATKDINENLVETTFKRTPIMSTYLIGFIISDFEKISELNRANKKIAHSTYVRKNAVQLAKFSSNYGANVFTALYNTMGGNGSQPNEISEIKQILLPDFYFSGMENWGVITYNEQKLFYDENFHNSQHLYNILYLMGHEMAHQWFGNSMTHEWWTYVWLKEGFATIYAYYGAAQVYPNWNLMEIYQTNVVQYVFKIDDDPKIRPMSFYVEKQKDILANYDRIAYEKSSCVLRMFDNALGRDTFKAGVVDIFLKDRQFKSATEDHLFAALDKALKQKNNNEINIYETFGNWTHQGGYPLLTLNVENNKIKLHQQRFLRSEHFDSKDFRHKVWHIPVNFEMPGAIGNKFINTAPQFWMKTSVMEWPINNKLFDSSKHWIIANIQQTGYYRVNYDNKNWNLVIKALKSDYSQIHVANRGQLVDDAFNLAEIGQLDYEIVLNLIEYLKNENGYSPWKAFYDGIEVLRYRLLNSEKPHLGKLITNFIYNVTKLQFNNFGLVQLPSESPAVSLTRYIVAKLACAVNNTDCIADNIPSNATDLRKIFYCKKLKEETNGIKMFVKLKQLIRESEIMPLRNEYITVLSCTENEDVLRILLLYTIRSDNNDLKLNDNERYLILASILSRSRKGFEIAREFIKKTWSKLKTSLCRDCLGKAIVIMSKFITNEKDVNEFHELLGSMDIDSKYSDDAIANIMQNIQWNILYSKKIENWLEANYGNSGVPLFNNISLIISTIIIIFIKFILC